MTHAPANAVDGISSRDVLRKFYTGRVECNRKVSRCRSNNTASAERNEQIFIILTTDIVKPIPQPSAKGNVPFFLRTTLENITAGLSA